MGWSSKWKRKRWSSKVHIARLAWLAGLWSPLTLEGRITKMVGLCRLPLKPKLPWVFLKSYLEHVFGHPGAEMPSKKYCVQGTSTVVPSLEVYDAPIFTDTDLLIIFKWSQMIHFDSQPKALLLPLSLDMIKFDEHLFPPTSQMTHFQFHTRWAPTSCEWGEIAL